MNQNLTSQIRKAPSRISTLIPAVAVLIAGCSSTPKDAAAAPQQKGGGTKRVSISDPQRGMSAASIEIPSGWKFAGLIVSAPGCHGATDSMAFTAEAQDGVTSIARLPGVRWTVTPPTNPLAQMQVKKCPPVNITTAAAFLRNLAVPNMHPGARIEAELPPPPDGQAALAKQLAQMQQQAAHIPAAFGQRDVTLEGARIRIAYDRNGQPVEEMLTAVISCNTNPQMGRTCFSRGITIARAPKGKLDGLLANPETDHIGASVQWNPQWMQRKEQEQVSTNQNNIDTNKAVFAQRQAANQAQFNQMIAGARAQDAQRTQNFENAMAGDRAKQAAIDASAHNTVNYSLDRKDYINPNTGQTITASNEYNHQWVNSSNDTLVQTNNPSFDPNGVIDPIRESWTELVPK